MICDKKLDGGGVKPVCLSFALGFSLVFLLTFSRHVKKKVTCTDEQCLWRTEELGIGVLVTNDIAFDSGVVDLLISKSYDQPLPFLKK